METITHHKFSLFRTQKTKHNSQPTFRFTSSCFDYLNTFDTLEEAKFAQKE